MTARARMVPPPGAALGRKKTPFAGRSESRMGLSPQTQCSQRVAGHQLQQAQVTQDDRLGHMGHRDPRHDPRPGVVAGAGRRACSTPSPLPTRRDDQTLYPPSCLHHSQSRSDDPSASRPGRERARALTPWLLQSCLSRSVCAEVPWRSEHRPSARVVRQRHGLGSRGGRTTGSRTTCRGC